MTRNSRRAPARIPMSTTARGLTCPTGSRPRGTSPPRCWRPISTAPCCAPPWRNPPRAPTNASSSEPDDMNNPILNAACLDDPRKQLARRICDLDTRREMPTGETLERFAAVDSDFQALSDNARNRLLGTALAWSEEDRREVAWLRHAN